MNKILLRNLFMAVCAFFLYNVAVAQVTLSSSPYSENFDNIGAGLPTGFKVLTGATDSTFGTTETFDGSSKYSWANTSGKYKNYASGTGQIESLSSSNQDNVTNRALGLKQTGSFGDAGAAFVFQVSNTTNKVGFILSFQLQSLYPNAGRTTTWVVDYGKGAAPTSYTAVAPTSGSLTTGPFFTNNNLVTVNFGNLLDNISDVVTIRIVALTKSGGSGSRASTAIDDFSLSWTTTNASAPQLSITDAGGSNLSSMSFPPTSITNPTVKSFVLNGQNLTNDISINSNDAAFTVSTDNVTYSSSLAVAKTDATNKQIFVKFNPSSQGNYAATLTAASAGATNIDVQVSGEATDPNNTDFEFNTCTNLGEPGSGFVQYSTQGAGQVWSCTSYGLNNTNGVNINGYEGGAQANEDWLISPKITKTFSHIPMLQFYSRGEFNGPKLQLFVSTDYDGTGNPNDFTWTNMNANFPEENNTWTKTTGIDLSNYKGIGGFYFAFKYTSSAAAGAARWTLDSVQIIDTTNIFSVTPAINKFDAVSLGSASVGKPIHLLSKGNGVITINAPTNFEVSTDNAAYGSSININETTAASGADFYVRFVPTLKQLNIVGKLKITATGGLIDSSVILSGSSYPQNETFNIAAYNMSFFAGSGSSAILRTPAEITQQIDNIQTVLTHLNVDIVAFEEMSSDSGLNVLLSQLNAATGKNYKSTVSQYWSHKEIGDTSYPPQKVGFIYDADKISLDTDNPPRAMFGDSTNGGYGYANGGGVYGSSFWSSGRLPYMATFVADIEGKKQRVRMVVLHAKAGGAVDDYNRREGDLQVLYDSLATAQYNEDNIIILGDYNDRLSTSIYLGHPSSYQVFVNDAAYYPVTYSLDTAGVSSFPGGDGMIDNILFRKNTSLASTDGVVYLSGSAAIENARDYISPYNKVVGSDHLPVYARFVFNTTDNTLGIHIINVDASYHEHSVAVSWSATTDNTIKQFNVLRSSDGVNFAKLGSVSLNKNDDMANYLFNDDMPMPGKNYYRIQSIDINGTAFLSNVVSVVVEQKLIKTFKVYPNPVKNKMTIQYKDQDRLLRVRLFDVMGRLLLKIKGNLNTINTQLSNRIKNRASGIYFLELNDGIKNYRIKIIKQ